MNTRIVQHHHDLTRHVAQKMFQEPNHICTVNRSLLGVLQELSR